MTDKEKKILKGHLDYMETNIQAAEDALQDSNAEDFDFCVVEIGCGVDYIRRIRDL